MTREEVLQRIIYTLKETEDLRRRLQFGSQETRDIELALLNQQVLLLYRQLNEYNQAAAAPEPSAAYSPSTPSPAPAQQSIEPTAAEVPRPVAAPLPAQEVYKPAAAPSPHYEPVKSSEPEPEPKIVQAAAADTELQPIPVKSVPEAEQKAETGTEVVEPAYTGTPASETLPPVQADDTSPEPEKPSSPEAVHEEPATHEPPAGRSLNDRLGSATAPLSLNERLAQQTVKKSLADKLKLSPIDDLRSAISLNQRIAFINHLFKGDDKEFKRVLNFVSSSKNYSEAKFYLQSEIGKQYGWREDDGLVQEFMELVYRKFL